MSRYSVTVDAKQVPDVPAAEAHGIEATLAARSQFNDLVAWAGDGAAVALDAIEGPVIVLQGDDGEGMAAAGDWIVKWPAGTFVMGNDEFMRVFGGGAHA